MRFSDIPGHNETKQALIEMSASGHLPHAIMLSGPSGTGKMMLARTFAQYLHCENPSNGEPCGKCNACRLHAQLDHPDLHFVFPIVKSKAKKISTSADEMNHIRQMLLEYPAMQEEKWLEIIEAGNSQTLIYVDEADSIVHADSYPPISARHKIFIIWQPERLHLAAANKLLKVIEEPSEGTIFIFVSNNDLQVLPTIYSRVQRLQVKRLDDSEIEEYLISRYHFDEPDAMRYAPLCKGSLGKADEFGCNSGETEEFLAVYQEIMRAAYAKRPAKLRDLSESVADYGREKIRRFLNYMARMIRENFIFNMRMPALTLLTPEEEAFSQRFSPFVNHLNVEDFMAETDRARRDIERNGNPRLILFDYFLLTIILLHRKEKK